MRRFHFFFNFLVLILFLAGCSQPPASTPSANSAPEEPVAKTEKRVSDRPGNTDGGVIIVEYHKIAKQEARWDRSIVRFRQDLERFYKLGFRPVLLSSYVTGKIDLPPGASPLIFTFDDSTPSQFQLLENGSVDPECAVGIWQDFAKKHPDFPVRASFFILPETGPWGPPPLAKKKLELRKEWGCEVGSHTIGHINLAKTDTAAAAKELQTANDYISKAGFDPFAIALPYGISPKDPSLIPKFHKVALLVGAGPAPPPGSPKVNLLRLPRIQGIDGDYGITYWLDKVEKGELKPYVQP